MKNKTIWRVVLPALAMAAFCRPANGEGRVSIKPYFNSDLAVVSVTNPDMDAFSIIIEDEVGTRMYKSNKIKEQINFQKLFDLKNLEDGRYTLILKGETTHLEEQFEVSGNKLKDHTSDVALKNGNKCFVHSRGDKLYVSQLSFDKAPTSITIFDSFGKEVYEGTIPTGKPFSGLYDITELPEGNYHVEITSSEKTFSYEFEK